MACQYNSANVWPRHRQKTFKRLIKLRNRYEKSRLRFGRWFWSEDRPQMAADIKSIMFEFQPVVVVDNTVKDEL